MTRDWSDGGALGASADCGMGSDVGVRARWGFVRTRRGHAIRKRFLPAFCAAVLGALIALPSGAADLPARASGVPTLVEYASPIYPQLHRMAGSHLTLVCAVHITADGSVDRVDCPQGADATYAAAAILSWKKSRFAPLQHDITIDLACVFALQATEGEPASPLVAIAENRYTVRGELLEAGSRLGVAGADVIVEGLNVSTLTDAHGRFQFQLPPGNYEIAAAREDYKPSVMSVHVVSDDEPGKSVMTMHAFRRENSSLEATVRASKTAGDGPSETVVSHEELRNVPGANNDPIRVLENLPGVARAPYAAGQLVVRGAQPTDTGAFYDGQKIPILYHLLNGPSVMSEEMVERIDFVPGGAGVFFGRQLAGVVDVVPRVGDVERLHGSAAIDLEKTQVFLRGPLGDSTQFAVGGRFSYVNPVLRLTVPADTTYQVPLYWDYQARLDQKLPDGSKLTVTAFGSSDSFDAINPGRGTALAYSDQEVRFHRLQLRWDKQLSQRLSLTVAPQLGLGSDVTATSGLGAGAFSLPAEVADDSREIGVRSQLTFTQSSDAVFRFGTDSSFERTGYSVEEPLALSLTGVQGGAQEVRSVGAQHFGAYGFYTGADLVFGRFKISPGMRADVLHWAGGTFLVSDPRIAVAYQFDSGVRVFGYGGIYHQAPQASQLDPKIGNPGLLPERAIQFGLGGEFHFRTNWSVKIESFIQRRTSLPFSGVPSISGTGAVYYPLLVSSGIARSFGVEFLLRRELSASVYGWIAYTLSRSQQIGRPGFPWEPTDYDQPHVFSALIAYRRSNNVEISARLRLSSGNPNRDVSGATFDSDTGNYLPYTAVFGSGRLPAFAAVDFQVNNLWTADNFKLSMYIEFDNLLARNNVEAAAYDYRYQTVSYVPSQPLTATVGAKIAF